MIKEDSDRLLEYVLRYNKNSFFVEAGAHDGITQSNTLVLEKEFGWNGLLIEPSPGLVQQCKYNRNVIIENSALVGPDYNNDTVTGNFLSNSCTSCINKSPDYFTNNELQIDKINNQTTVHANTFDNIFNKYDIKHIDFLSLDVEGYELDALKGIDFNKTNITLILVETANRPFYQKLVRDYMYDNNYNFIERISGNDDLFLKDSA